ncbi:3TM-type holin [Ekhidna sp. To15]|uniref:3TM-type holin n=1 Tax=Ekhidna sp. To15 TaxID=3395267 RepID=UPI003F524479
MIGFKDIVKTIGDVADDLITTKEEKLKAELEFEKIEAELAKGQMEINKMEAQHRSIFVAGWRPAVGWICAIAVAYQFIVHQFLLWGWSVGKSSGWIEAATDAPPAIEAVILMQLLFGMLGLGAYRTYEKKQGVASNSIGPPSAKKRKEVFDPEKG